MFKKDKKKNGRKKNMKKKNKYDELNKRCNEMRRFDAMRTNHDSSCFRIKLILNKRYYWRAGSGFRSGIVFAWHNNIRL